MKIAGKRVGVREALRFVGDKLPSLRLPEALGSEDEPLSREERDQAIHALASLKAPRVPGTLGQHLAALSMAMQYEVPSPTAKGGRPSQRAARSTLRSIVHIFEANVPDHAPKVTAYVLWLTGNAERLCEEQDGETAAAYLARLTGAIEKATRIRSR